MIKHVVLITVDSLRADAFGDQSRYGRTPTPRLDEFSQEGVNFSQAVANGPSTPSSFPSILTSTYPLMYGGYAYLDEERPFVAKTLAEAGFDTVGYHSNPYLGRSHNYQVGFETFNDTAEGSETITSLKDRVESRLDPDSRLYGVLRRLWHLFTQSTESTAYAKAPTVVNNAIDWLDDDWNREDNIFMWLHFMDVHYPFMPPADSLRELGVEPLSKRRVADLNGKMHENPDRLTDDDIDDLLDLYYGELRFTDEQIGRLLDHLDERGILEETAIVFTADHGEGFGEHGRFGHHPYLYDELLRVPLVVYAPGVDPDTVDEQVSLLDIGPTIYDLLDVPVPDGVQGESLLSVVEGSRSDEDVAISTALSGEMLACRTAEWKCFWQVEDDVVELYDLQNDPDELDDVSASNPEVVSRFRTLMEEHLETADRTDAALPDVEESDEAQQRLRDLGYME
jgi:arylsulfatase A-like enzyme